MMDLDEAIRIFTNRAYMPPEVLGAADGGGAYDQEQWIRVVNRISLAISQGELVKLPKPNFDFNHIPYFTEWAGSDKKDDICAGCPNDPRNGGSGICNCALPCLNGQIIY